MASKSLISLILFLAFNLLCFNLTAAYRRPSWVPPAPQNKCPMDALKINACANVLNLVKADLPIKTPLKPCCPLIDGLVDLEAAVCLCTSLRINLLNTIHLNIPIHLSLAINKDCSSKIPPEFQCPE